MRRERCKPREDWRQRLESLGFDFHTNESETYWVEDACYRLRSAEVDRIQDATQALHALCMEAVERVVADGLHRDLGLDELSAERLHASWQAGERALLGRMDLAYDGHGEPKLLEYNADTPTALFEASVVQWHWLEDTGAGRDQYNLIHEKLVEHWRAMALDGGQPVYFAGCMDLVEDRVNLEYLGDTCLQAGFRSEFIDISDIGCKDGKFVDLQDRAIAQVFKLYPWEWMMQEPFAAQLPAAGTRWIEPAWKQVLSNKSLLPLLWRLFPGHPNLLPASHDPRELAGPVVVKPRFGREGEGVRIEDRAPLQLEPGWVCQAYSPLFASAAGHALVGSWVIGGEAVGMGIREDADAVTRNTSRFVPHCFD